MGRDSAPGRVLPAAVPRGSAEARRPDLLGGPGRTAGTADVPGGPATAPSQQDGDRRGRLSPQRILRVPGEGVLGLSPFVSFAIVQILI